MFFSFYFSSCLRNALPHFCETSECCACPTPEMMTLAFWHVSRRTTCCGMLLVLLMSAACSSSSRQVKWSCCIYAKYTQFGIYIIRTCCWARQQYHVLGPRITYCHVNVSFVAGRQALTRTFRVDLSVRCCAAASHRLHQRRHQTTNYPPVTRRRRSSSAPLQVRSCLRRSFTDCSGAAQRGKIHRRICRQRCSQLGATQHGTSRWRECSSGQEHGQHQPESSCRCATRGEN